ncbi:TonB-dependent receptor plug domain-containing protein [Saccharobesus litoralis]|nr:TonB-dependent receptor [Saccharobesus litoralis]
MLNTFASMPYALAVESIWDMSLQQLMQIEVVTASKSAEQQNNAPANITVISKQEIQAFGANNLHDILRRVSGLNPLSGSVLRDNFVSIRGQHSSSIDRRTLLLIDGRPFRDGNTGGLNTTIYRTFPIQSIERIEVIKGPGSILYGSNATSGVINIITKPTQKNSLKLGAGSFATQLLEGAYGYQQGDLNLSANLKWLDSNGWDYTTTDQNDIRDSVNYAHRDFGGRFALNYKNFNLSYFISQVDEVIISSGFVQHWPATTYDKHHQMLDLGYEQAINQDWQLATHLTLNHHKRHTADGGIDIDGHNTLLEVSTTGQLNSSSQLTAGATYHRLKGDDLGNPNLSAFWDLKWWSAYYQLTSAITQDLTLTLGQHYNDIANMTHANQVSRDSDFSSKLALNWHLHTDWHLKLLWTEAFRSPYGAELALQSPTLVGNPNLKPEKVTTAEMQLIYQLHNLRVAAAWFNTEYEDALGPELTPGSPPPFSFSNKAALKVDGGELEMSYEASKQTYYTGSWSYQSNQDHRGIAQIQKTPKHMIKIGIHHSYNDTLSLGLFNTWLSAQPKAEQFNPNTRVINNNTGAYHHLTLKANWQLSSLTTSQRFNSADISLFIDNLLQANTVYQPDIANTRINALPQRAGRSLYLNLQLGF